MKTPTNLANGLSILCHQLRYKEKQKLKDIAREIQKDHSTVSYHLRMYQKKCKSFEFLESEKEFKVDDFRRQLAEYQIQLESQ